jgi:TorA maturation chaperone TorD
VTLIIRLGEDTMRDPGLAKALEVAGGVRALARSLGVSQPAISMWKRVPVDRVAEVESVTGISRADLRPDIFGLEPMHQADPTNIARSQEYLLLAALLWRAPDAGLLSKLTNLKGDATPVGIAHINLSMAAAEAEPASLQKEFFDLFIGLGRGELLPYASFYLTGFLHEKPLARVRADLAALGLERDSRASEPEDHIAVLCEVMGLLAVEDAASEQGGNAITDKIFFERHLKRWAARFFSDLEIAESASFYRAVGALGRLFMEIEAEAFSLPA